MKQDGYGRWHRPAFGQLHTGSPGLHAKPRVPWAASLLPREGAGDYRHPAVRRQGANQRKYSTGGGLWHNPVQFEMDTDSRADWAEPEYIVRRNGRPVFRPYVWRAPGWEERLTRFGLDLAELAAADAAIEQRISDRRHEIGGHVRRNRPRAG